MVEADFVERGGGGVRGDVAADVVLDAIGADDHGEGVPADEALDAALEFLVAGEKRLEACGNGVGVRSVRGEREVDAGDGGVGAEALENFGGDFGAAGLEDGIERFEPLLNLEFVHVVRLGVRLVVHEFAWSFFVSIWARRDRRAELMFALRTIEYTCA